MSRLTRLSVLSFILAFGVLAGARLLLQAVPQGVQNAGRHAGPRAPAARTAPAPDPNSAAPSLWSASLSRDRRTIILAYDGAAWITGLEVGILAGNPRFGSAAPGAGLVPEATPGPGQWVFKVAGREPYNIVLKSDGPALEVSLAGFPAGGEAQPAIVADVDGGADPIQARLSDPGDGIQQMESGGAGSTLSDCIYDRFRDQALQVLGRKAGFRHTVRGWQVTVSDPLGSAPHCRFRVVSHVFGHRLPFFAPLDKKKWPEVPVGWISWCDYFSHVTEKDIVQNAEAIASYYKPFGLKYCLVDAGWQAEGDGEDGSPIGGDWNAWNAKFPHGMKWLADQIHARGLYAGLWLSVFGNADEQFY